MFWNTNFRRLKSEIKQSVIGKYLPDSFYASSPEEERLSIMVKQWNHRTQLFNKLEKYLKTEFEIEYDKMGNTGNYKWMKKFDKLGKFGKEVYHFGRFRALEDLDTELRNDFDEDSHTIDIESIVNDVVDVIHEMDETLDYNQLIESWTKYFNRKLNIKE